MERPDTIIEGVVFENQPVDFDGNWFERCTFNNCVLNYNGADFMLVECNFGPCVWHLGGNLGGGLMRMGAIFGQENAGALLQVLEQVAFPKYTASLG